jgi:hypothetical protein
LLLSVLDGGEWSDSASHPGRFNTWETAFSVHRIGGRVDNRHGPKLWGALESLSQLLHRKVRKWLVFDIFPELYHFCSKPTYLENPACALFDPTAMTSMPWSVGDGIKFLLEDTQCLFWKKKSKGKYIIMYLTLFVLCIVIVMNYMYQQMRIKCKKLLSSFLVLPSSTYLFTAGVEGFCDFSLDHMQAHTKGGGLLWTRDRPVAETSTWEHQRCERQVSMPLVWFEPTIPASARPQT